MKRGIPCQGVEPAWQCAQRARERGVPTLNEFFGRATAEKIVQEHGQANLLLGNNVLAHVPDVNDFVAGMKTLLAPGGVITMEFPHLVQLVEENQFDTIYHEHYSYYTFSVAARIFAAHGLSMFDVEELPTHGGSLRIYAQHAEQPAFSVSPAVNGLLQRERSDGYCSLEKYASFGTRVAQTKRKLLTTLVELSEQGKSVVGYGAPGKGNTLLNYCGIGSDLLPYTVDRNPVKQGTYTPGMRIPIHAPEQIAHTRPDYVLILPWNLRDEITEQISFIRNWGGRFIVPIPEVEVIDPKQHE